MIYLLIIFIVVSAVFCIGVFDIQRNMFVRSIHTITTEKPTVYLTFDDSPRPIFTEKILEILKTHQVKASFFSIGKNIESHPDIFRKIVAEGHSVGNHTYSHNIKFTIQNPQKVAEDIQLCQEIIEKETGLKPTIFRPPFGITHPSIAKGINKSGLISIGWSVRSLDTVIEDKNKLIERVVKKTKNGSIILLHDNGKCTIDALSEIIVQLKKKGFGFEKIVNFAG
jgi:peptidoglycan-N-acetylglucosamine deacetylase